MRLTIYSKPGCHLCDEMKAAIGRVLAARRADARAGEVRVDEVDISTDPGLLERYGLEIPVLTIDGKKVAKYRVSEEELHRLIEARRGPVDE